MSSNNNLANQFTITIIWPPREIFKKQNYYEQLCIFIEHIRKTKYY